MARIIKPIDGVLVSALNENDQHTLFLIAVKLNEVIVAVNDMQLKAEKPSNGDIEAQGRGILKAKEKA